jgi:hypothetical protein
MPEPFPRYATASALKNRSVRRVKQYEAGHRLGHRSEFAKSIAWGRRDLHTKVHAET